MMLHRLQKPPSGEPWLPRFIGLALRPVPLFAIQPVLDRLVTDITARRPELFHRLGPHVTTDFAIDVDEFPFVLLLRPDPKAPRLTARRRSANIKSGASIGGPFMTLFKIMDGGGDSDALFFSRQVRVGGDTEAAMCLRNALDDLEGSVVDDIMNIGGPLYAPLRLVVGRLRQDAQLEDADYGPTDHKRADHKRADHKRADHKPADHKPADLGERIKP
jgi:O2-independent ubiquinone biosynthesis accessory factor UbiT